MKKIAVIGEGILKNDGSAGHRLTLGIIISLLKNGNSVDYFSLIVDESEWLENNYDLNPSIKNNTLNIFKIKLIKKKRLGFSDKIHSFYNKTKLYENIKIFNNQIYDSIISFDSIAISISHNLNSKKFFSIIGDPVGKRFFYSYGLFKNKFRNLILSILIDYLEKKYFKKICLNHSIGMYGAWHAKEWSKAFNKKIIDLRPIHFTEKFDKNRKENSDKIKFIFGGSLNSTASQMSIKVLDKVVYKNLKSILKDNFELKLIGANDLENHELLNKDNVVNMGYVKNFEEECYYSDIFLLPGNYPVGVRTRIMTALSSGCICIAHSSVLKNMPELKELTNFYNYNNLNEFKKIIPEIKKKLLKKDKIKNEILSFYKKYYSIEILQNKLREII